jgi:DNA replication factor GINS
MHLEDLASKLVLERESDKLQELDGSFYDDAAAYIRKLEQARQDAADYKEAGMIDDEIKNARILIEGIFDRRMSKVTMYASIYAAGTRIAVEGMTKAERAVFDALVAALERGRAEILAPALSVSQKAGLAKNILGGITTKEQPIENSQTPGRDADAAADAAIAADTTATADAEVMTVKVLRDIPRFVGVDGRQYQLSGEDVVVLPKANALVLCNKNIAIPLHNPQG